MRPACPNPYKTIRGPQACRNGTRYFIAHNIPVVNMAWPGNHVSAFYLGDKACHEYGVPCVLPAKTGTQGAGFSTTFALLNKGAPGFQPAPE